MRSRSRRTHWLGELLKDLTKHEGGRPTKTPSAREGVSKPRLAEFGVSYKGGLCGAATGCATIFDPLGNRSARDDPLEGAGQCFRARQTASVFAMWAEWQECSRARRALQKLTFCHNSRSCRFSSASASASAQARSRKRPPDEVQRIQQRRVPGGEGLRPDCARRPANIECENLFPAVESAL